MALTYTPAGHDSLKLPEFTLPTLDGDTLVAPVAGARATLIAFICGHCPYVLAVERRLIDLAAEFKSAGLVTIGLCANDAADYPEDRPEALRARWQDQAYGFPYAIDREQTVARALGAVCTPDFFLFDAAGALAYRGRLDDSWRDPAKVRRRELADAVTAVIRGEAPGSPNPSMGCSIKWLT